MTISSISAAGSFKSVNGQSIEFRPATYDDVGILYQLQIHPETRRYFRNPESPSFEEHSSWMARCLEDPALCNSYFTGSRTR